MSRWQPASLRLFLLSAVSAVALAQGAEAANTQTSALTAKAKAADVMAHAKMVLAQKGGSTKARTLAATQVGLTCDGSTDNTAAFANLYSAYQASSGGFQIILPSGVCNFSSTINWKITKPLSIVGSGSNATILSEPSTTKSFDGLVFTITNGADLTLSGFAISKSATMPSGANFANEALKIGASNGTDAGQVVLSNMWIEGANESDTSHGWAVGLEAIDLARPVIDNLNVKNGGITAGPSTAGVPTPTSPGATPAALAPGIGTDIYIHGVNNMAIDTAISNSRTDGGIAAIDIDTYQGLYVTNGDFVYADYGIRSDSGAGTDESMNVDSSIFNDAVAGFYLNQNTGVSISGNLINWPGGSFPSSHWQGVWLYNSGGVTVTGNNFFAGSASDAYGVAFSAPGPGGYAGFPDTVNSNTFLDITNTCVFNDANYSSISGTGNSAQGCGTFLHDGTSKNGGPGGNAYFNNNFQYPDVYTDGNRDTTIAKGLTIGSYANTGTLAVDNSSGATTFSVDGSGNTAANGNLAIGGSQSVLGSGSIGAYSGVGTNQNSGNNALYLYAAEGHSSNIAAGGSAQNFYISPAGGAPSTGSTVNQANLLLPTTIGTKFQRGVTRADVNCNDLGGDAEDLLVIQDYNNYATIGTTTNVVRNSVLGSTTSTSAEIFGLKVMIGRDTTTGSPVVVGTVSPSASAARPALTCSGRIETQITY